MRMCNTPESRWAARLTNYLDGVAYTYFKSLDLKNQEKWSDLIPELQARFCDEAAGWIKYISLNFLRQQAGQSVDAYSNASLTLHNATGYADSGYSAIIYEACCQCTNIRFLRFDPRICAQRFEPRNH